MKPITLRIAEELGVREQQAAAAISLLDGGATVPFVARYRKEATGALDDAQLRTLDERLRYLRELDERRAAILDSIGQQGKLDAALKQAIEAADSKARLEDLYLPYRPKRRTKAQIAREAGLEPLAEALLARPDQSPEQVARGYVEPSKGVIDSATALEGARAILVERFSEDATGAGTSGEVRFAHDLYGAFPVKRLLLVFAHSSLSGAGKAVLHPVACDPVPGARGRGQGTETLAELGGLPP